MKPIRAILIDDSQKARDLLRMMIEENFRHVTILAEAGNIPEAVKLIHKNKPDLVFLDIEMPGHSGLEILDFFPPDDIHFHIIFVTAYSEYALQAFELSAVDYLLKPVSPKNLERALNKISEDNTFGADHYKTLQENLHSENKKIALKTGDGILFIKLNDILYLRAEGTYTHFILDKQKPVLVSKNLAEYDKLQEIGNFMRINRSNLININRIQKIHKISDGSLTMDNGDDLIISEDKKRILLERIERIKL